MTEQMLEAFSRDYLEPLYYFCLRKTGSAEEGEELAADISLCVVTQLRRGIIPQHFSAWIWRIARNRYSRWAERQHTARERLFIQAGGDDDCDDSLIITYLPSDELTPEEAFLHAEELTLLRRELAFISREYRELIVAHPHAALLEQALDKLAAETQQKLAHITHPAVHDHLKVGVGFTLYDLRVMMTDTLLDLGYLTLPADPARDLFMTYLYLRIQ